MKIYYSGPRDCEGCRPELAVPDAPVMSSFADIYYHRGQVLRYVLRIAKGRRKQQAAGGAAAKPDHLAEDRGEGAAPPPP